MHWCIISRIDVLFHTVITYYSYIDNMICPMYFHSMTSSHWWHFSNDCAVRAKLNEIISILSNSILMKIALFELSSKKNFVKVFLSVPVINRLVLYCMTNNGLVNPGRHPMNWKTPLRITFRKSIWFMN